MIIFYLLLSFVLACAHSFFFAASTIPSFHPMVQVYHLPVQFGVAAILALLAWKKPFEKVCQWTLGALALLILLFAFFKNPFPLYYTLNVARLPLFTVLIWGLVNQKMKSTKGYFLLALILGLPATLALPILGLSLPKEIALMLGVSFVVLAMVIVSFACRCQTSQESESGGRFPYLSAALFLGGCLMVKTLIKVRGLPPLQIGVGTLVLSLVWAFLGTFFYMKRGWRSAALFGALAVLMTGFFPKMWMSHALLMATSSALFFPLVQILFRGVELKKRFFVQVVTQLLLLPLFKMLPSLAQQGLIVKLGSLAATAPYIRTLAFVCLGAILVAAYRARRSGREVVQSVSQ
ncbi:MAG: hypothetical protein H7A36_05405 [Chlamydiales bacterium]|nr:hypothetical protein [Chlamydiales bacterium]